MMANRSIAFVFPGQGSHYYQMGRDLFDSNPIFRSQFEMCNSNEALDRTAPAPEMIYRNEHPRGHPFYDTFLAHVSIFATELALAQTVVDAGVMPSVVLGVSVGSIAAAVIAGCISLPDALKVVTSQARAACTMCPAGGMVAGYGSIATARSALSNVTCELAGTAGEDQFVLSCPDRSITEVEAALARAGSTTVRLPVSRAFHSRWIDAAKTTLLQELSAISFQRAHVPIICSLTGNWIDGCGGEYLWRVIRERYDLGSARHALAELESVTVLDLGPAGSLASALRRMRPLKAHIEYVSILSPFGRDLSRLSAAIELMR